VRRTSTSTVFFETPLPNARNLLSVMKPGTPSALLPNASERILAGIAL
jgi:hypothetical protein